MRPRALALALLCGVAGAAEDDGWRRVSEKDGIRVETRTVPGARVHEVRATTVIAASPSECYAVVRAFADYPRTMPYVKASKVLRSEGDRVWAWARVEAPLVSARDYVLRYETTRDEDGQIRMAWERDESLGPAPTAGVVRVPVNKGSWTFSPIDEGTYTRATYRLLTDPGGQVTAWLADQANKKALPDVMRAVRKAAAGR